MRFFYYHCIKNKQDNMKMKKGRMVRFSKKMATVVVVLVAVLMLVSQDVFAAPYGMDYSGGVKFSTSNVTVNAGVVSNLAAFLVKKNVKTTKTSSSSDWKNGYVISGSSDAHCFPVKYFKLPQGGLSSSKYGMTLSDGNHAVDVYFNKIATSGLTVDTSVAVGDTGFLTIDVGRIIYSDKNCTNVKDSSIHNWSGTDGSKAFLDLTFKPHNVGDSNLFPATFFRLSDIDGGQSYKIMNSDTLLSKNNMYVVSKNVINVLNDSSEARYVAKNNHIYSANTSIDKDNNIYVKLGSSTQRDGLRMIFGFEGMAGSGIEYYVDKNTFQGTITVKDANGTRRSYVGPSQTSATGATYFINNCSSIDGCKVTFDHKVERLAGGGEAPYKVSRTSNYDERGVGDNNNLKSGTGSSMTYSDGPLTLYPGQTVCEKLTFGPNGTGSSASSTLTLCASALGKAQPDDPSFPDNPGDDTESDAFIDMRVKNNDGKEVYRNFQKLVYGKPYDKLTFRATYNPLLQYAYFIDGLKDKISNWNNAFAVFSSVENGPLSGFNANFYSNNHFYELGNTEKRREYNDYTVQPRAVGGILMETAKTNHNDNVKNTPGQIIFSNSNGTNIGTIDLNPRLSSARALIPYNFITNVEEPDVPEEPVIYAGEDTPIKYPVSVDPKPNGETGGDDEYATIVRDAKIKVVVYVPTSDTVDDGTDDYPNDNICAHYGRTNGDGNCRYAVERNQDLNPNGLLDGVKTEVQATIREDRPAGTRICVAAAVYPANSGADTNLDKRGNDRWRISRSTCFVVAKKPTFQVWGGNFYSIGQVNTLSATKTIESEKIVFSSWVERDVTATGLVKALASGAATGLFNNAAGGGSRESRPNYCDYRTPLSISNNGGRILPICPNAQQTGLSGVSADVVDIEKLIGGLPVNMGGVAVTDDLVMDAEVQIANGQTFVARTNGDITINANVIYGQMDSISLANLADVPKAFIYANNISIGCNVRRIDAVLIANRTINTCNTLGDVNAAERSNPLMVNGAIVANKLNLGRTFGAYTGVYTKIPAEIVNYDTSILLWARSKGNTSDYNNLTSVYRHELAPRR